MNAVCYGVVALDSSAVTNVALSAVVKSSVAFCCNLLMLVVNCMVIGVLFLKRFFYWVF